MVSAEDLTDGNIFPWGDYVMNLPEPTQHDVLGPGITKFEIVRISGVEDTSSIVVKDLGRVDFFVTRADRTQVRLHPHQHKHAQLLYVDRPGPKYWGHLARRTPWPAGCWGATAEQSTCRLCPDLPAERQGLPTADVIATVAGMPDKPGNAGQPGGTELADRMTHAVASVELQKLIFENPNNEIDLSDGTVFPWVRWLHHQPQIKNQLASGVTKFCAVIIGFVSRRTGAAVKGRIFRMDRLDAPPLALLPGYKSGSELVTDNYGTYPAMDAMQDALEKAPQPAS